MCPAGKHWVSSYPRHVSHSKKNPDGITIVDGHCRSNPSKKDQIYPDEVHKIAQKYFGRLRKMPAELKQRGGNDYDRIIAGWVKYWNDVLEPREPLDVNIVKALISTESDFKEKAIIEASKGNWARGLTQITDQTIQILKDEKGELKNFLINLDQKEAFDPNLNICAGIRWLFHKKNLLEHKLNRSATWEEAVMEYKSFTRDLKQGKTTAVQQQDKFRKIYEKLKKGSK